MVAVAKDTDKRYQVMVVDDSSVSRDIICSMLQQDPSVSIASSLANGALALRALERNTQHIDVVVLDMDMPVLDGLSAIPRMLAHDPDMQIILMASADDERFQRNTLLALNRGAKEFLAKPDNKGIASPENLDFLFKLKSLAAKRRASLNMPLPPEPDAQTGTSQGGKFNLRKINPQPIKAIAIGASTGGPQAVVQFLKHLGYHPHLPVFLTQHMPASFTSMFAKQISSQTDWPCVEASNKPVEPGTVWLAPGDWHLLIEGQIDAPKMRLSNSPPENFCRPAVDPMFRTIAATYGREVLSVILTGMGQDGLQGGKVIVEKGGYLLAQDEKSAAVWGMPGAVAMAGLCNLVQPVNILAANAAKLLEGRGL